MYAVVSDSGTQFFVEPGQRLLVDFRPLEPEQATITFERVLLVGGDGAVRIGKPTITLPGQEGPPSNHDGSADPRNCLPLILSTGL